MRNISFQLTHQQIREHSKTVTRRLGWEKLKPGTRLCAIQKGRGLKKGQKVVRLAFIEVKSVRREQVRTVEIMKQAWIEMAKEGFPGMAPNDFVKMFCKEMKCKPTTMITRIEFCYL